MNHEDQYTYQRIDLATDAIRLLRLLKGNQNDPIRCELFEAFLHQVEGVPYEALSYCWGTAPAAYEVWVDGRKKYIQQNLYIALLALRQSDEDKLLWVDAICIDQDNHKEKGHQVGHMRRIYENAEEVIVWLGPSNAEINSLMDQVKWWDTEIMQQYGAHRAQGLSDSWIRLIKYKEELGEKVDTDLWRRALIDILMLPWFQRVWILQEVASARRATLYCGTKAVPSRGFSLLPLLLEFEPDTHTQAVLDILPGYRRKETWWGEAQNLKTLLLKFKDSQATDPRDKIYALLGIASDARTNGTLRPDYEISPGQAIRNTISFLLFQEVRDPSCLALPMDLSFEALLQVLPNLPEYVVSWAVLHDCDATVTATIPQVTDINRIPERFSLHDFDAYFSPYRNLVVHLLENRNSSEVCTIRAAFKSGLTPLCSLIPPLCSLTPFIMAQANCGNVERVDFVLQHSGWEVDDIEALLIKTADESTPDAFKVLFLSCKTMIWQVARQKVEAILKEAAILNGPIVRRERSPQSRVDDSANATDQPWRIDTVPRWLSRWLRLITYFKYDPITMLRDRIRDIDPFATKLDQVAYLDLVVAALALKDSGIMLEVQVVGHPDKEYLLPSRWEPNKWLAKISALPYREGVSPTDDALVYQARRELRRLA